MAEDEATCNARRLVLGRLVLMRQKTEAVVVVPSPFIRAFTPVFAGYGGRGLKKEATSASG
jgi:hypothetical protein